MSSPLQNSYEEDGDDESFRTIQIIKQLKEHGGRWLRCVCNPTDEMILAAVELNGLALEYVPAQKQTKELVLAALKSNGLALQYVVHPTEEFVLAAEEGIRAAVTQNGLILQHVQVPVPSQDIQLAAVTQNGNAVGYIETPSPDVQLAAVTQNGNAVQYIKSPTEEAQMAAVKQDGFEVQNLKWLTLSPEVQLAAVTKNAYALEHIRKPTYATVMAAVKSNGLMLHCVKNNHMHAQTDWHAQFPDDLWHSIVLEAVKSNGNALQYAGEDLKYDLDILYAAIKANPSSERHGFLEKALQIETFLAAREDACDACDASPKKRARHM